jgi:hypothetical protein
VRHSGDMASMNVESAPLLKKQRIIEPAAARAPSNNAVDADIQLEPASMLLGLPREVLVQILSFMDAPSLLAVSRACKAFRTFDSTSKLRLVESVAKTQALAAAGDQSGRWRCVQLGGLLPSLFRVGCRAAGLSRDPCHGPLYYSLLMSISSMCQGEPCRISSSSCSRGLDLWPNPAACMHACTHPVHFPP